MQKECDLSRKSFAYESGLGYSAQPCQGGLKKNALAGVVKGVSARIIRVLGRRDRSLLESGGNLGVVAIVTKSTEMPRQQFVGEGFYAKGFRKRYLKIWNTSNRCGYLLAECSIYQQQVTDNLLSDTCLLYTSPSPRDS